MTTICLVREKTYPLDMLHGKYRFLDFRQAVEAWNDSQLNHPLSASGYRPEDLFFLIQRQQVLAVEPGIRFSYLVTQV